MGDSPLNQGGEKDGPESTPLIAPKQVQSSLVTQVVRGSAWNVTGTLTNRLLGLVASVVVARLLLPEDFAIAGLAASLMGLFFTLTSQGFAQALVQKKLLTDLTCHSVFWFMTLNGFGLAFVTLAMSPLLAKFYAQSTLIPVMAVLAGSLVVSAIGAVPNALLQRKLRFRDINLVGMAGSLIAAVLGVFVACIGYGYWALIVPGLGASLFMAVRAFALSGYRPAWQFSWSEIKETSVFGFSILGSNLLRYFSDNSDYLIMSRFWPKTDFGQYYFAFERSRKPFNLVVAQLDRVLFPVFSRIQDDLVRLRRAFLRGTHSICLVIYPLHVLLIGLADPLIPLIFGDQWRPAVPVFQVYAVFAFMRGPAALVSSGVLAINKAQFFLAFNFLRVIVTVPILLYLGVKGVGIIGTAAVITLIWFIQTPFFIGYFFRKVKLPFREVWHSLYGLICVTIVMGLVLAGFRFTAAVADWPTWLDVTLSGTLSSALFLVLSRKPLLDLYYRVRRAFRREEQMG